MSDRQPKARLSELKSLMPIQDRGLVGYSEVRMEITTLDNGEVNTWKDAACITFDPLMTEAEMIYLTTQMLERSGCPVDAIVEGLQQVLNKCSGTGDNRVDE